MTLELQGYALTASPLNHTDLLHNTYSRGPNAEKVQAIVMLIDKTELIDQMMWSIPTYINYNRVGSTIQFSDFILSNKPPKRPSICGLQLTHVLKRHTDIKWLFSNSRIHVIYPKIHFYVCLGYETGTIFLCLQQPILPVINTCIKHSSNVTTWLN